MKISRLAVVSLTLTFVVLQPQLAAAATNELATALQKGLFEEEANHNFEAAIQAYQSAIARFDEDRKLAATAVFRLAECYRKQSKTNEALTQYQRVVREFSDQPELSTLSRQNVAALGGAPAAEIAAPGIGGGLRTAETIEIARIQEMIRNSPDLINARNPETGQTPLHKAAYLGQVSVAQYLLDNGADVNARQMGAADTLSRTPLHAAADNGHRAMVELLLNRKADVNATDDKGATALHIAARRGFKTVADVLLAHGAEVDARDSAGETPLHYAAAAGNTAMIDPLLARKADLNAKDRIDATPLLLALAGRQSETARALIAEKADLNIPGTVTFENALRPGFYPVHLAVLARNDELLELLLKNGANPNVQSGRGGDGGRALYFAVASSRKSTVELLLKNGADPNLRNQQTTPLILAVKNGAQDIVELLLASKADPNAVDSSSATPLVLAISRGDRAIVELLLDHHADIEKGNKDYPQPPLFLASFGAHKEIVELLLSRGANPNATDYSGRTPLAEVTRLLSTSPLTSDAKSAYEDIGSLLRQHGALKDLPHLDRIEIRRAGNNVPGFAKGTNNLNQFTLFELLAVHYGFVSARPVPVSDSKTFDVTSGTFYGWPFPDLANATIHRATPDGRGRSDLKIELSSRLAAPNCHDFPLQWGDVLEIPELDHPINAKWSGFSVEHLAKLKECLKRTVQITVKGETKAVVLLPEMPALAAGASRPGLLPNQRVLPQFALLPVLNQSGMLRASSDLTRVKVRRLDPGTGQSYEMILDCSRDYAAPDLWLRDGDAIEVPEKM